MLLAKRLMSKKTDNAVTFTYNGGSYASGSGTTFTYSSAPLGTVTTDRLILVTCGHRTGALTGVTIGGVSASQLVYANTETRGMAAIYLLAVSSGTAADIVLTGSSSLDETFIGVYSLYGASATPASTASASTSGGAGGPVSISTSVNVTAGNAIFCSVGSDTDDNPFNMSFTNVTKDAQFGTAGNRGQYGTASLSVLSSETGRVLTATYTETDRKNMASVVIEAA